VNSALWFTALCSGSRPVSLAGVFNMNSATASAEGGDCKNGASCFSNTVQGNC
jgi:hypothetical protein